MLATLNYKQYCYHCDRDIIVCGKCGNNTCNGGYGELPTADPDIMVKCDQCPSAYEEYQRMNNASI